MAVECGLGGVPRLVGGAEMTPSGRWTYSLDRAQAPRIRTDYYATSGGQRSAAVRVDVRPSVRLEALRGNRRFRVWVWGYLYFGGKRVFLERFDTNRGWLRVGSAILRRESGGSKAVIRAAVRRGDRLRAILPITPRPSSCYVTGISRILTV